MFRLHDDVVAYHCLLLSARAVEQEPGWVGLACCPNALRHGGMLHAAARHLGLRAHHGGFRTDEPRELAARLEGERRAWPAPELVALLRRLDVAVGDWRALAAAMPLQPSERRRLVAEHALAPPDHPGVRALEPAQLRAPPCITLPMRLAPAAQPWVGGPATKCVARNRWRGLWVRGETGKPPGLCRVLVEGAEVAEHPPFWRTQRTLLEAVWLEAGELADVPMTDVWFATELI